jgi:DNA modification methylase
MPARIITGDCLEMLRTLPAGAAQCCVTSPPYYGLRDYGHAGQIGLEETPDAYVARLVEVFREVRRVLRDDGTLWLNLGDSYAGSWGAQSRGGAPSAASTLAGNGHRGGGPKIKGISAVQMAARPKRTHTGSTKHMDGIKPKDLLGIPWAVAFALRADGWFLRSGIVWQKPNPMPESIKDRPTSAHEMVFLLAKSSRYFYDHEAIKEPAVVAGWDDGSRVYGGVNKAGANVSHGERTTGRRTSAPKGSFAGKGPAHPGGHEAFRAVVPDRNSRNVWTIATQPYSGAHFATMPPDLAERCIKAGSKPGDVILDPFGGAGTTGLVADRLRRNSILIELNPEYARLAAERIHGDAPLLGSVA